jgi:ribosome-associated translation inhibitor RaiA
MKQARATRLNVQFDAHHFTLTQPEMDKMLSDVDSLGRQVENFPVADLHVLIEYNSKNNDYSVKLSLILPGGTLVGNDHDLQIHPAFERCLSGLEANVRAYKDRLGQVEERQKQEKGTHQDLEPTVDPEPAVVEAAVREGDYAAFREATFGYEEGVRRRVGRWVQRYPDVEARIGHGLLIDDLVEEVFLMAFDEYERRPAGLRFGEWLDNLVDPAVKALRGRPDEELENIRLARTARVAANGPDAV